MKALTLILMTVFVSLSSFGQSSPLKIGSKLVPIQEIQLSEYESFFVVNGQVYPFYWDSRSNSSFQLLGGDVEEIVFTKGEPPSNPAGSCEFTKDDLFIGRQKFVTQSGFAPRVKPVDGDITRSYLEVARVPYHPSQSFFRKNIPNCIKVDFTDGIFRDAYCCLNDTKANMTEAQALKILEKTFKIQ
jgi:hypothetical protein